MDRRKALRWMLAASAALRGARRPAFAGPVAGAPSAPAGPAAGPTAPAAGYGTDPDLMKPYRPGDAWPLTLSPERRRAAAALCDAIIPADAVSPAASAVGLVDFIDEWVSAPYAAQVQDRGLLLEGLEWLDAEAVRRYGAPFAALAIDAQHAICDDICDEAAARPEFARAAAFFARYRDLTAGGFYSTPAGFADLGYVGNRPQARFDGPPPDLLRRLGLDPESRE